MILYDGQHRYTLSYPKALLEVKLNRRLAENETADHSDEDKTNNDLNNLQLLNRVENIQKHATLHPAEIYEFICPECENYTIKSMRDVRGNWKQGKAGPFCSKHCAGVYSRRMQLYSNIEQANSEIKTTNPYAELIKG